MRENFLPELLAPAGDMEKLQTALVYGADAVYLGGQDLSLRAKTKGFDESELKQAVELAHNFQAKIFFTLNILAWEKHLERVKKQLVFLSNLDIDGLIVADPGILMLAQEIVPHLPLHLSTQANTSNSASLRFWEKQGVKRVNLSREMDFQALKRVRRQVPQIELEIFVHGAMCMAISGRCFMSAFLNQRSANAGLCTHPCRFDYAPTRVIVREKQRSQEELWEIVQTGEYSQIFSAQDLCLIKYLGWLNKVGINALKIEGRMKTSSYLAPVVDVYKTALKTLGTGSFPLNTYMQELVQTTTRSLSSGFFLPERKIFAQPRPQRQQIVARILEQISEDCWLVSIKNPWHEKLKIEILLPGLKRPQLKPGQYALEKENGERLSTAHPGTKAILRCSNCRLQNFILLRQAVN